MSLRDNIYDYLNDLDETELRYINNDYMYNDYIYFMDDLDDYLSGYSPTDILDNYSWVDTGCHYFCPGTEECSDYISDFVSIDDMVDYVINNDEDFGFDDLRELLDEGELEDTDFDDDEARFESEY